VPRYLVERSFTDGLRIPMDAIGPKTCAEVVGTNLDYGVTWVHSYVTPHRTKTYCICGAPSPQAVRQSATANNLPVDRITEVPAALGRGRSYPFRMSAS
jgi:Protein of unknown function (DUF4242)